MRPSRFVRLAASGLLLVFAFVHNAAAQTDPISTEIHTVVEQYFRAIAAGDTDAILALSAVPGSRDSRDKDLLMMRWAKALMDGNGGLERIAILKSEPSRSLSASDVWVGLIFNNGTMEVTSKMRLSKPYREQYWQITRHGEIGFLSDIVSFYSAISRGDKEAAIARVSFARTAAGSMIARREYVLWIMDVIKQQIDANGGLKTAGLAGFSPNNYLGRVDVPIRLVFNNEREERSLPVRLMVNYEEDGGWKLDAENFLPVAFMNEINELIETCYQAVFSGDVTTIIENSVLGLYVKVRNPQRVRNQFIGRLERYVQVAQLEAEANGGLKAIEMDDANLRIDDSFSYFINIPNPSITATSSAPGVSIRYNNNKISSGHITTPGTSLILHQGKWKLLYTQGVGDDD